MHILQVVDDNDNVLFDLLDVTGAANPNGVCAAVSDDDFNLSAADPQFGFFEPDKGVGGFKVAKQKGLVPSSMRVFVWASSYDNLTAGLGALARRMENGCTLKWQPDGASVRYIDVEAAAVGALFRGQPSGGLQILDNNDDSEGVPVNFWRQPALRGARLYSSTNKLRNATLLIDTTNDNTPDNWVLQSGATADGIDATLEAALFTRSSSGSTIIQTVTPAVAGENWTASFYGKKISGNGSFEVRINWLDSGGSTLSSITSSASASTTEVRVSISGAAPTSTASVQITIRISNVSNATQIAVRNAQVEKAAAASTFVVGNEIVTMSPAGDVYVAAENWDEDTADTWGTADIGGTWTYAEGAAADHDQVEYDTANYAHGGSQTHSAVNTAKQAVLPLSVKDLGLTVEYTYMNNAGTSGPTGANNDFFVCFRRTDANNMYRWRIVLATGGATLTIGLEKIVGGVVSTVIAQTATTVASNTSRLRLRMEANGTTLRAKIWSPGTDAAEPGSWNVSTTDASITAAGAIALRSFVATATTNLPVSMWWRRLVATDLSARGAGRTVPLVIHGDEETPVEVSFKGRDNGLTTQFMVSSRSNEGLTGFRRIPHLLNKVRAFDLSTGTVSGSASVVHDQNALGGKAIKRPYSTTRYRLVRYTITDANTLEALRGEWDVIIRLGSHGQQGAFRAQMRYVPSVLDPSIFTQSERLLDWRELLGRQWVPYSELNMGRVTVPETGNLSGLAFDFWTRVDQSSGYGAKDSTTGVYMDATMLLVPTDTMATILPSVGGKQTFLASEETSSNGTLETDTIHILQDSTDWVQYDLGVIPAGRWRATVTYTPVNVTGTPSIEIRRNSGATTIRSRPLTLLQSEGIPRAVEFDADGTNNYQIRVTGPTTGELTVIQVEAVFIDKLGSGETLRSNFEDVSLPRVEKLDTNGKFVARGKVAHGGTPLRVEPGLVAVYAAAYGPQFYGIVNAPRSDVERSVEFGYEYEPRYRY